MIGCCTLVGAKNAPPPRLGAAVTLSMRFRCCWPAGKNTVPPLQAGVPMSTEIAMELAWQICRASFADHVSGLQSPLTGTPIGPISSGSTLVERACFVGPEGVPLKRQMPGKSQLKQGRADAVGDDHA